GNCGAVTLCPAACSRSMTPLQHEPSAHAPCTRTMFMRVTLRLWISAGHPYPDCTWGDAMAGGLVGRDSELSQLCGLVDPPPMQSQVRVLLGAPGLGKTALLAAVTG